VLGKVEHFISRKALNIEGLGSETVAGLLKHNLISDASDLYNLSFDQLLGLEFYTGENEEIKKRSLQQKSAENIILALEKSKSVSFERVLFGLGIRHVGETVAKKIAKALKNIEHCASATKEDLLAIDEVGEVIAESFVSWFNQEKNKQFIQNLRSAGCQLAIDERANTLNSEVLKGLILVVSGSFESFSRDEIKEFIEKNGGKLSGSISSKTSFIVAGTDMGPAKLKKAEDLKIPIISEFDLRNKVESAH
ncbi:MAG: helix-hairpin-helix domain-containing protein, partial [Bacteroidota bacterium]